MTRREQSGGRNQDNSDAEKEAEKLALARELADELFGHSFDSSRDYYGELETFCVQRGFHINCAYKDRVGSKECVITIRFPDHFGIEPVSVSQRDMSPLRAKHRAAKILREQLAKDIKR
ncbi:hypothetical protein HYV71_04890 [Candidatus Uhrbacteria bacterium]|nr:hypothetical protein [Candidatus Uhrbacteria bacterium]